MYNGKIKIIKITAICSICATQFDIENATIEDVKCPNCGEDEHINLEVEYEDGK